MRNICLTLEYDGSLYHGWQRQKDLITAQQVIEDALADLFGTKISVNGCGRTDAGVHGMNYTCNFAVDSSIESNKIPLALNTRLPCDIRVKAATDKDNDFHARFSATGKRYLYKIINNQYGNVFMRNYAWHYKYPLNINLMKEAANYMLGEHDFKAFAASGLTVTDTVRKIYSIDINKSPDDILTIEVCGNGFLYNMVRIITGTLVYCGSGKIGVDEITDIITSKDRTKAGITAPAQGLYMKSVLY